MPQANFCGGCGVDLREPKGPETSDPIPVVKSSERTKTSKPSKKDSLKDEKVIHWHTIRSICNSMQMSFPFFFFLMMVFAKGEKQLGFCDCASCNQGYREMLAAIENVTEKKNLTAQSREIVLKARQEKIDGHRIDFSHILKNDEKKPALPTDQKTDEPVSHKAGRGKIVIELEPEILEEVVINVLKSERGRELISSIPRKRGRNKTRPASK